MFWTKEKTPCGKPVYVAEMSDWEGNGCPDPITNEPCPDIELEAHWDEAYPPFDEIEYFVGKTPSGAFVRLFND